MYNHKRISYNESVAESTGKCKKDVKIVFISSFRPRSLPFPFSYKQMACQALLQFSGHVCDSCFQYLIISLPFLWTSFNVPCCFSNLKTHTGFTFCVLFLQESLVIDTPRVRKQTRHYNSFEEDELMEFSELDSDSEERPCRTRRLGERARRYLRAECFRVEKNLLIFG